MTLSIRTRNLGLSGPNTPVTVSNRLTGTHSVRWRDLRSREWIFYLFYYVCNIPVLKSFSYIKPLFGPRVIYSKREEEKEKSRPNPTLLDFLPQV